LYAVKSGDVSVQLYSSATAAPFSAPVLQITNDSVQFALPEIPTQTWLFKVCGGSNSSAIDCTPLASLNQADPLWTSCEASAGCASGGVIRVFGRQLAFDGNSCTRYHASAQLGSASKTQLRLISSAGTFNLLAATQSCYSATFKIPAEATLPLGVYSLSVKNGLQGSTFTEPAETDQKLLQIVSVSSLAMGSKLFPVSAGAGGRVQLLKAIDAAAAHAGGGVVQLGAGIYEMKASDTLVMHDGVTLRGAGAGMGGASATSSAAGTGAGTSAGAGAGAGTGASILRWPMQTLGAGLKRHHHGMIMGGNTTRGWVLEDLRCVVPRWR
jgi:hypothetical protein